MTTDNGRRQLAYAVLACLAGAGLALFAATRTWAVEVAERTAPLPPVRTTRTGGDVSAWLPTLAVVALAGAGALVATRGAARRAVGVLLLLVGLGIAAGAVAAAADLGGVGWVWPVLCAAGGLSVGAAGAAAVARGHGWPAMGARYDRAATRRDDRSATRRDDRSATRRDDRSATSTWDAIDRGEDPTA